MSWYFLGGFSAYLSVPSGRWKNHSGCSVSHGWSGEDCSAMSIAISTPCSWQVATSRSKSSSVPSSGATASWPPSCEPMPYTLPGSPGPATSVLLAPLRFVLPIGWIGVKYRTSKPSSAICGTTLRTPSKPPQLRGKSSYQELKRARSRSTLIAAGCASDPAPERSGQCSAAAATSGASAASRRSDWSLFVSPAVAAASVSSCASLDFARCAAAAISSAPSLSSPVTSVCPPSSLRCTSWRQEASGSIHASIEYCQGPQAPTSNAPSQVSPSMCASNRRIGDSFQRPLSGRYFSTA